MKNKWIRTLNAMLLVGTLSIGLCACGGSGATGSNSETLAESVSDGASGDEENTNEDDDKIGGTTRYFYQNNTDGSEGGITYSLYCPEGFEAGYQESPNKGASSVESVDKSINQGAAWSWYYEDEEDALSSIVNIELRICPYDEEDAKQLLDTFTFNNEEEVTTINTTELDVDGKTYTVVIKEDKMGDDTSMNQTVFIPIDNALFIMMIYTSGISRPENPLTYDNLL